MKHRKLCTFCKFDKKQRIIISIIVLATILLCTMPMKLSPIWNGKIPDHRNQYELLTDSMLKGHLYIDYGKVDQKLLNMENPYDPIKREKLGVKYHWDHAFYNGHFYMYFGVAPVFLTFMPYKIITGNTLVTYHATQLYVALFIIGVFSLFSLICKLFYKKTKLATYILASIAFSTMSIWLSVCAPSLYCTAITAGLCMAIWSLFFFIKAVYEEHSENKSIILASLGSTFGALTFACRPPIGFVNFLVIPLLIHYLKNHKINRNLILKLFLAALPYLIVAILLMVYNYLRFDNPFEFGQTYQLTMADQHNYNNIFANLDISELLTNLRRNFFDSSIYLDYFPYVNISGIFLNFPILFLPLMMIFNSKYKKNLKEKKIYGFYLILLLLPIVVTVFDLIYSPGPGERYRMDEYYLMGILTFISIINYYSISSVKCKKKFNVFINIFLIVTFLKCVLLFLVPHDMNYTQYYPDILSKIIKFISFGILK